MTMTTLRLRAPALVLPLLWLAGACGGRGPASPSGVAALSPATLAVVSGGTGLAVAGASVSVDGRPAVSDAAGHAAVSVGRGSAITIEARGFFLRETLWRGDPVLQLWPVRPDAGETFVSELVYNQLVSDGAVTRPVSGVYLILSAEVRDHAAGRAAQERAADRVAATLDGAIPFVVADGAPAGGVAVDVRIDPRDAFLAANPGYGAITRVTFPGNRVTSGSITYRGLAEAGALSLATHEMGHLLGLGHPSQRGLMSPATIALYTDFTGAERFAIHMMQIRLPGNRPPDNDRDVSAAATRRSIAVGCPWGP